MKIIKKLFKWWKDPLNHMTEQKAIVSLIVYFMGKPTTGFMGSLITTFFRADPNNFAKLANEWPVLADVICKYRTVDGYSKEHGINQD